MFQVAPAAVAALAWSHTFTSSAGIHFALERQYLSLSQEIFLSSGEKLATPGHGSSDPGPQDKIKHLSDGLFIDGDGSTNCLFRHLSKTR